MDVVIALEQKECQVSISPAAEEAMGNRDCTLAVEIVVTLACCIRKAVEFRDARKDEQLVLVTPLLGITLVSAEHRARQADINRCIPPIKNWNAIAPRWLTIDFQDGVWRGDFGYSFAGDRT